VSISYYTHLEQGNTANVSMEVLDAIARALRLTASCTGPRHQVSTMEPVEPGPATVRQSRLQVRTGVVLNWRRHRPNRRG
jgi:transcriptional regulator with XRE-family HTH domain